MAIWLTSGVKVRCPRRRRTPTRCATERRRGAGQLDGTGDKADERSSSSSLWTSSDQTVPRKPAVPMRGASPSGNRECAAAEFLDAVVAQCQDDFVDLATPSRVGVVSLPLTLQVDRQRLLNMFGQSPSPLFFGGQWQVGIGCRFQERTHPGEPAVRLAESLYPVVEGRDGLIDPGERASLRRDLAGLLGLVAELDECAVTAEAPGSSSFPASVWMSSDRQDKFLYIDRGEFGSGKRAKSALSPLFVAFPFGGCLCLSR